jgi:hypothetical protein
MGSPVPTDAIDKTFNAWWQQYGGTADAIQRALERTRKQVGPPMPQNYVPPPLRQTGVSRSTARGTLNLTKTLDTSSFKVTVNAASANVGVYVTPPSAATSAPIIVPHLTNNFSPTTAASSTVIGTGSGNAWTATGELDLDSGRLLEFAHWDMGFVQFQQVNKLEYFYAGKTSGDGTVKIIAHTPPAMPEKFCLDSGPAIRPWSNDTPTSFSVRYNSVAGKLSIQTGDHPIHNISGIVDNGAANVPPSTPNFLASFVDDREFWTIFCVRNNLSVFSFVAHFHWSVRWEGKVTWKGLTPTVTLQPGGTFHMDPVVAGAPTQISFQKLLDPTTQLTFANYALFSAVKAAVVGVGTANRVDTGP